MVRHGTGDALLIEAQVNSFCQIESNRTGRGVYIRTCFSRVIDNIRLK